jgi:hypothetical protein
MADTDVQGGSDGSANLYRFPVVKVDPLRGHTLVSIYQDVLARPVPQSLKAVIEQLEQDNYRPSGAD